MTKNAATAMFNVESSKTKLLGTKERIEADVNQAYSKVIETDRLYYKLDDKYVSDLDNLVDEMIKNYEKKNIGIIEFLDYYDAYKTNIIQINNLKNNRANAFENLNFALGKDITNK